MVTMAASVCMRMFFWRGGGSHNSSRAEIKRCFNSWCGQSSKDDVLVIIAAFKGSIPTILCSKLSDLSIISLSLKTINT